MLEALDRTNSYLTANDQHRVALSFDGRYDRKTYRNGNNHARFRFTWKAGLSLQSETWDYDGQAPRCDRRTAWLPSLGLEVLRNTLGMRHELELQTSYRQQLPSMSSLMELRFDGAPPQHPRGQCRPAPHGRLLRRLLLPFRQLALEAPSQPLGRRQALRLPQRRGHVTGLRCRHGRTHLPSRECQRQLEREHDGLLLHPARYPRLLAAPLPQRQLLPQRRPDGADVQTPVRSTVCTNYLSLPVKVEYSRDKVRVGARVQAVWNHAVGRRMGFRNIDAADISTGLNCNVTLPWSLQLATDLTYFVRRGYANDAMNTDDLVWNAQQSKSVIRGRLTLALVGYDILGQLSHITYTVNAQGTTENWRNVIPRYAMLRVIYRFNKQPKKR